MTKKEQVEAVLNYYYKHTEEVESYVRYGENHTEVKGKDFSIKFSTGAASFILNVPNSEKVLAYHITFKCKELKQTFIINLQVGEDDELILKTKLRFLGIANSLEEHDNMFMESLLS